MQARNNNFIKHTLKKKHCRRNKSSKTLTLIVVFSSSLRIVRNNILHKNCQQKTPIKDTQNNAHMAKNNSAHLKLPHKS